ncbi:MAG: ABC transporter ATP-binding protein [Synergistaceae bacterium]|jgi:putative ABC transport system ATP-binding protein|nr:ABC transporter ATP-binding protein [Synergistaceae bacterium]
MILEAREIKKQYHRDNILFSAVNDVSLSIGEGEFVCIVGRSGSGKSTLLNILAGLLTPTSGSVSFEGREYGGMNDGELSRLRNTRLGYIMQGHNVLSNFTVLQNVLLPHIFFKRDDDPTDRALSLLEQVGLRPLASQYPSSLSGGELHRVSIARALLMSPGLLIADEPTGDLDEETVSEIMGLFAGIVSKGTAVLMVTHNSDAASYADRMYTMQSGRLSEM